METNKHIKVIQLRNDLRLNENLSSLASEPRPLTTRLHCFSRGGVSEYTFRKAQFSWIGLFVIYLLMPKIPGQSLIPVVKYNALFSNANITLSVLYTLVQIDLARHFVTADFEDGSVQGDRLWSRSFWNREEVGGEGRLRWWLPSQACLDWLCRLRGSISFCLSVLEISIFSSK